jgi:hypothetical protein
MIARARASRKPRAIERRGATRETINRRAQYIAGLGALPRDCMVIDMSESGARLFSDAALPDVFTLVVSSDRTRIQRECRVVWRLGGECGVAFVVAARG